MFQFINGFIAIALMAVFFPSTLNASRLPLYRGDVFIIIEKKLYPHLDKENLRSWIEQLESEAWYTKVLKPETSETLTASKLKQYMVEKGVYLPPKYPARSRRNGIILIGDFPYTSMSLSRNNDPTSDLWYMDTNNGANLIFDHPYSSPKLNVNAGFSFDPLSVWVSRIQYIAKAPHQDEERDIVEEGKHINNYLKKNVACRSTGFTSPDCLSENQFTTENFWESKALISTSVSNKIAGEVFLDSFAKAQKNWKKWQDYIFNEGWEHCYSFLGDMYRIHNQTHYPATTAATPSGIIPFDKILLYVLAIPAFGLGVFVSTLYGLDYPSSQKYLGAAWAVLLAASLVPPYNCSYNDDYTHKRHYLPILFGDGTLRKF
ncbi:hypothetical protein [Endozoicomonas euniceicola]|uniref:Uncharacterized protein n=1 Tax=Endozoicomonas euniceicola TaxID=1234143 RepID=A0ABY6GYL0_9GAMM|nr:hypothetical protein [Endozoicomonas euniceicola]UYM17657.1 hypothetical protein NX720_07045 [Endozoicomonas euniceicola]